MHIKGAVAKFNFDTAPDSNDWSDAAARQQREQTVMAIRDNGRLSVPIRPVAATAVRRSCCMYCSE